MQFYLFSFLTVFMKKIPVSSLLYIFLTLFHSACFFFFLFLARLSRCDSHSIGFGTQISEVKHSGNTCFHIKILTQKTRLIWGPILCKWLISIKILLRLHGIGKRPWELIKHEHSLSLAVTWIHPATAMEIRSVKVFWQLSCLSEEIPCVKAKKNALPLELIQRTKAKLKQCQVSLNRVNTWGPQQTVSAGDGGRSKRLWEITTMVKARVRQDCYFWHQSRYKWL